MFRKTMVTAILALSFTSHPGYANEEIDLIRQDCEQEVQGYGIVDPVQIKEAVNDCVESQVPVFSNQQGKEGQRDEDMPVDNR